jgi:hypothetical protein
MSEFGVDAHCFDPYKSRKFRVKCDGRDVAGVSNVTGLRRTTEAVPHHEGC